MQAEIDLFLAARTIAVVGVSRGRGFGNTALRTLRDRGWTCYPVNARADAVAGERCFRRLEDLPARPDAVLAVVPPAEAERVVEDCVRLGVKSVWLQQGAESPAAVRRAEAAGLAVVAGRCALMYARPRGIHRLHRWLTALAGRP